MKIITIEREFGSGGRELGKRLSDELQIPCYDQEIINEVAKLQGLDPAYVKHISESDVRAVYPMTIGRRFALPPAVRTDVIQVLVSQQEVIKSFAAQEDCIVIGYCADIILHEFSPMNLFVYADKESKVNRCLGRAKTDETEQEIFWQMRRIDKERRDYRELFTDTAWGRKETYHLCVNTSGKKIKALVPALATYIQCWFQT